MKGPIKESEVVSGLTAQSRTIVGIDSDNNYEAALDLLGRINFEGNQVTLAHYDPPVEPMLLAPPVILDYMDSTQLESEVHAAGASLLRRASEKATSAGLNETGQPDLGVRNAAVGLMEEANKIKVDLIAVGARDHNPLKCFVFGSVGRALAIESKQSFLVARDSSCNRSGKVRAVFATDHSDYAKKCFEKFISMRPQGIDTITVVTATNRFLEDEISCQTGFNDRAYSLNDEEVSDRVAGSQMVHQLATIGISGEFREMDGAAEDAIRLAMADASAHLLILASKGHGFLERLLTGSLALHAVVAERYSVLVLRLPN